MVNKKIKYVLYVLMIISLFLSIKSKVNAQVYIPTSASLGGYFWIDRNEEYKSKSVNVFAGYGTGEVNFTVTTEMDQNAATRGRAIVGIDIQRGTNYFACDIGTTYFYIDSTKQNMIYSARCPVNADGAINGIRIKTSQDLLREQKIFVSFGNYITFTPLIFNTTDTSSVTNAINNASNQAHQDSVNTQNKLNDINNTMNDSSTDNNNMNNTFNGLNNNMASNNTISQLLLMPVRLLQKLLNAFSNGCSSINTGEIFGYELVLPCIDLESLLGSTLWSVIDVIGSGALAYAIGKKMIKIFNQFTNLKEGGLESAYD